MKKKKALVFGVTGQDGSYTADFLIDKGYEVHGVIRKSATGNTTNINHIINNKKLFNKSFFIHRGDLADVTSIYRIINDVKPNEIYNQADQDHVSWSYDMVSYASSITASAVGNILECIKQVDKKIKYLQPCTSNMFGITESKTQNEDTLFNPQSPYAVAKTFAYYITRYYRQNHNIHASVAILYNHESPRRPVDYVTRKITKSVAEIYLKKRKKIILGDISARIDWGFSRDYVEAEWLALQQKKPNDYVISTGKSYSVEDFLRMAFEYVDLNYKKYLRIDKSLIRPTKTSTLVGDSARAKKLLKWKPRTSIKQLVEMMVEHDIKSIQNNE
jgi:GDPmannose 4,6-dehydratase